MIYQVMPNLSDEEYNELKSDIASRGVMIPIEFDENGNVLDGHHRLKACGELGITDYPKVIRAGLSEEEKYTHARKLNMARRHLTQEQKRSLIQQQLQATPEKSDRQIARDLGISNKTVSTHRKEMEENGELCKLHSSIGADGKERPRQVMRETKPEPVLTPYEPEPYIPTPVREEYEKPIIPILRNTGNNERYTPSEYIEAARRVMGTIDLDPASSALANETVRAEMYYTAEMDGLKQDWYGNIWMNPPYAKDLIGQFAEKLANSDFEQAIILVHNATETKWFKRFIDSASAVVFPTGRINCLSPNEENANTPLQGSVFIYCGNNTDKFLEVFKSYGWGARL